MASVGVYCDDHCSKPFPPSPTAVHRNESSPLSNMVGCVYRNTNARQTLLKSANHLAPDVTLGSRSWRAPTCRWTALLTIPPFADGEATFEWPTSIFSLLIAMRVGGWSNGPTSSQVVIIAWDIKSTKWKLGINSKWVESQFDNHEIIGR